MILVCVRVRTLPHHHSSPLPPALHHHQSAAIHYHTTFHHQCFTLLLLLPFQCGRHVHLLTHVSVQKGQHIIMITDQVSRLLAATIT
jgi:hypothetical protein